MGAEFTWVYAKTFGCMKDVPEATDMKDGKEDNTGTPSKQMASPVAIFIDSQTNIVDHFRTRPHGLE